MARGKSREMVQGGGNAPPSSPCRGDVLLLDQPRLGHLLRPDSHRHPTAYETVALRWATKQSYNRESEPRVLLQHLRAKKMVGHPGNAPGFLLVPSQADSFFLMPEENLVVASGQLRPSGVSIRAFTGPGSAQRRRCKAAARRDHAATTGRGGAPLAALAARCRLPGKQASCPGRAACAAQFDSDGREHPFLGMQGLAVELDDEFDGDAAADEEQPRAIRERRRVQLDLVGLQHFLRPTVFAEVFALPVRWPIMGSARAC